MSCPVRANHFTMMVPHKPILRYHPFNHTKTQRLLYYPEMMLDVIDEDAQSLLWQHKKHCFLIFGGGAKAQFNIIYIYIYIYICVCVCIVFCLQLVRV